MKLDLAGRRFLAGTFLSWGVWAMACSASPSGNAVDPGISGAGNSAAGSAGALVQSGGTQNANPGGNSAVSGSLGGHATSTGSGQGTTNLFATLIGKSAADVDAKVTTAVNRFFGIGTSEPNKPTAETGYRCYYELPQDPSQAFIWAADSNDIRSEGMSYGMMIAVQMDLRDQFDKLWNFAKTNMQYPGDTPVTAWKYYFRWQGAVNSASEDSWPVTFGPTVVPAPDGDEYFAAALYLADRRWGSAGTYNYQEEADRISAAMLHNAATGDGRNPIVNPEAQMVVFVPYGDSSEFTDPSYHLPAFYELFASDGPAADSAQWQALAARSRSYLVSSAHPVTGLHPDYATFEGAPKAAQAGDKHDQFRYDAWRVVMNMAVDYAWFSSDATLKTQIEKYHTFFASRLGNSNVTQSLFNLDGTAPADGNGGGSTALTATLAAGSLASAAPSRDSYVSNLWNVQQQVGKYRYYQESVYLLGLLVTAGKFSHTW